MTGLLRSLSAKLLHAVDFLSLHCPSLSSLAPPATRTCCSLPAHMFAARSHVRTTLLSCASRCLIVQSAVRTLAAKSTKKTPIQDAVDDSIPKAKGTVRTRAVKSTARTKTKTKTKSASEEAAPDLDADATADLEPKAKAKAKATRKPRTVKAKAKTAATAATASEDAEAETEAAAELDADIEASGITKPDTVLEPLAHKLREEGVWAYRRGRRRGPNEDKYRVNVVSEALCDDIVDYIKPTLARHDGCDIIDIFPGVGLWSKKLNDVLKPRSHLLLEPDADFYRPYLEPLVERPGVRLLPISGIVWEQLNKVLTPDLLPHQVERKYTADETPQRNDTLLVTMNLSMYPRRKFRAFESLAQLVVFQIMSSIRPGALFQKYGLVRMLVWVPDAEKNSVLPRNVQRRRKMAIEAELSTEYVCEIAGGESTDSAFARGVWFRRDAGLDTESAHLALERMRRAGFVMPPGRAPQHVRDYLAQLTDDYTPDAMPALALDPATLAELARLAADFAAGKFDADADQYKRMRSLEYYARWSRKRGSAVGELLRERLDIVQALTAAAAADHADLLAAATARAADWSVRVNAHARANRAEILLQHDNMHILHQTPPVLNWDRRYVEPLRARPTEFYPAAPTALLDIQPKAVARVLRDLGPNSDRGGDMFDLVLRTMSSRSSEPVQKALNTIYAGAGEGVVPLCPSLRDPAVGGSPIAGAGELSTRTLNERQWVEIAEGWMKWPFRPTYQELVSRTMEDFEEEIDESGNKVNTPADL